MRSIYINGRMFCDGDEVLHRGWDITGVVRIFDNPRPGEAPAEVAWDDVGVADELAAVANQLQVLA